MLIKDTEFNSLLGFIWEDLGYDFRQYSRAHIKRRIVQRMRLSQLPTVSDFAHKISKDQEFRQLFFKDLSINVTEMFRDPSFFKSLREHVIPALKTWSFIKIWHAGCSTGEEVYSMAILLKEEGLYDKSYIYATDFNLSVLEKAKQGIYPASNLKKYANNYAKSGAKASFSDYYYANYGSAIMDAELKKNIIWGNHNLVSDGDFTEAHLILCRNVLIYFNRSLQNKVHQLFLNSLVNGGMLCLGSKESINFGPQKDHYQTIDLKNRIYKRKYSK